MWHAIVGSRTFGRCTCAMSEPTLDDVLNVRAVHPEDCQLVLAWLLVLKIVTRLAKEDGFEGIVSGGAAGADSLAEEACAVLGVKCHVERPRSGPEPFWQRAFQRNGRIVSKAAGGKVIALFAPGPRSSGTENTIMQAKAAGLPVHVWHNGSWSQE